MYETVNEHDIIRKIRIRNTVVLTLFCVITVCLFSYFGTKVNVPFKNVAITASPFDKGFLNGCAKLCFGELFAIALISICRNVKSIGVVSIAVLAIRGAALGAAAAFCISNAVSPSALGIIASYGAVTLLIVVYAVIVAGFDSTTKLLLRVLVYTVVTGTVAVLRIIPYLTALI